MTSLPVVESLGDRALVVRFAARPSRTLTHKLSALSRAARDLEGVIDAAPGHRTLLVEVESDARDKLAERLSTIAGEVQPLSGRLHKVPIRYDGEDVDWVCRTAGLNRKGLEEIHSRKTYDVRMIGSPRFIYLSSVSGRIAVPRLEDPRLVVPGGSVGIGGRQTGIYGRARPGGWRLIGTVVEVPEVSPGDQVKFLPR